MQKNYPKNSSGKKTVDLLTVFSDRVTCEYCQDVVRRIKKGENIEYLQYQGSKYITNSRADAIYANFDLYTVDGKPLYAKEQIDENKYKNAISILNTLP